MDWYKAWKAYWGVLHPLISWQVFVEEWRPAVGIAPVPGTEAAREHVRAAIKALSSPAFDDISGLAEELAKDRGDCLVGRDWKGGDGSVDEWEVWRKWAGPLLEGRGVVVQFPRKHRRDSPTDDPRVRDGGAADADQS